MIKLKKTIFFIIKSLLALVAFLTIVLFFYSDFFYEPLLIEKKITENEVVKNEKLSDIEEEKRLREEEQRLKELQAQKKIKIESVIEDGLYATVGNKAITKSDIVNEIKMILIINNQTFSEDQREKLHQMAIKSIIKRSVKEIEIEKRNFFEFNQQDLEKELLRMANNINVDMDAFKNIFASNELDFSLVKNQLKVELQWNSLIFQLYKNMVSINLEEIDEQLKLIQNKNEIEEYLIAEIVIESVEKAKLESTIRELKDKIEIKGFESVAASLSISDSATRGGDLGWINENQISKKLKSVISDTPVGNISKPILLPDGILIFKVKNKRKIEKNLNMEEIKNQLVNSEKTKILNMYSSSHYSNLRRSITIKILQ